MNRILGLATWLSACAATVVAGAAHAGSVGSITPQAAGDAQCLAMAVYYESATEPRTGKEAVAQIVLNRLAHPNYPKSVCAVVWQGSSRRTGCQFTFTCDGSLARAPVGRAWEESVAVARLAMLDPPRPDLTGALNYHADYVNPGWARALRRVARIGRHIFYAPPGGSAAEVAVAESRMSSAEPLQPPVGPSVWGLSLEVAAAARR